jgi:hypothetical protein
VAQAQEEKILRLTVTLDDRAALQQLARLEQSLRDVTHRGGHGAAQHMHRFANQLRSAGVFLFAFDLIALKREAEENWARN